MPSCPRCGEDNPVRARFCLSCGTSLQPVFGREERKIVSVLFVDLVGFTARAERLDPEDVRALQEPYWRNVRAEIERHGGTVEKFIGDAVMGLFGAPVAHEDDPERAVRAALAIRDWAVEQDRFQVRVAVATGEALVRVGAEPLAGEGMVSGDVANTASRLQSAAAPNAILVDEKTRRATRDVIDYRDAGRVEVKGKAEPIRVWEASQARSRIGADLVQHARPLVGRERELDVLRGSLVRSRLERSPQLVTLVGVPGIGKSRLVHELMQVADAEPEIVTWRQGRSLPYGDGVSYWALTEIVKAQAGILESDADAQALAKLVRAVQALIDDAADAAWVESHLRPLVGLGGEGEAAEERQREAAAAWRRFLEALADWRPAVLVFEDVHWADDGLLEFVEELVDWIRDVPLLVIATARPELLERRPSWAGGKANANTLSLSPLSGSDTVRLVRQLVGGGELDLETEHALVAHAAGNALYAEQYARMWEERGTLEQLAPPETVQNVIAARLDALSPAEKSLLQNAAVLGKVFWQGALLAVNGIEQEDAQTSLHALERKEFVQRARRSAVEGDREYAFRHALLRDVAYGQLPRAMRADKHERAAAWIESLGRADDHAEMLAHHYRTAMELAHALGRRSGELVKRTRRSLVRAGERAVALNGSAAAAESFERALELTANDDEERPHLLFRYAEALFRCGDNRREDALEQARSALMDVGEHDRAAEADVLLAEVWWTRGQRDRCERHVERALKHVQDAAVSPARARVLAQASRYRMLAGEWDDAVELGTKALAMAEQLELDEVRAHALITVGTARFQTDERGRHDIERGIELALTTNQLAAAARGYQNLSSTVADQNVALEFVSKAEELDLRRGDREAARYPRGSRVHGLFALGRWDEAVPLIDAFIDECESGKPHYHEAMMRRTRAWVRLARDDVEGALDDTKKALSAARAARDPQVSLTTLGDSIYLYMKLGKVDDATQLGRELLTAHPQAPTWATSFMIVADQLGFSAEIRRAVANLPQEHRFNALILAIAERRISDAIAIELQNGDASFVAELRVVAAQAWLDQGSPKQALAQLKQALAFYRSVGATRFIRETEALLETARTSVHA
jgi:class 3 adenylate cyclase